MLIINEGGGEEQIFTTEVAIEEPNSVQDPGKFKFFLNKSRYYMVVFKQF